ncbi:hypothetical protein [Rhizobium sp. TAL182]|nr:hypothetical protein [Rhizobium sp. TAL182]
MSTAWLMTIFFGVFIATSFAACAVAITRGGCSSVPFKRRRRS